MSFLRTGSCILRKIVPARVVKERAYSVKTPRKTTMSIKDEIVRWGGQVAMLGCSGFVWYLMLNPDKSVLFNANGIKVIKEEDPNN